MRVVVGSAFLLALVACRAQPRPVPPTWEVRYACSDLHITRAGNRMMVDGTSRTATLDWSDEEGDHFVFWPRDPTDRTAIEIVATADPRHDAIRRHHDASSGAPRDEWHLLDRQVCAAQGGYTDALVRYLRGDSLERVAADLNLGGRNQARDLVYKALKALHRRYYRDR